MVRKAAVLWAIVVSVFVTACAMPVEEMTGAADGTRTYTVFLTRSGQEENITLWFLFPEGREASIELEPEADEYEFESAEPPILAVGISRGEVAIEEVVLGQTEVFLDLTSPSNNESVERSALTEGGVGYYDVDSNGDVRFFFPSTDTFSRFYCTSWLPWLGISGDPNRWTSWDLTDFLPRWRGKKLLVPRRHRIFHRSFYGFDIERALWVATTR
jgi:hypothetical protein